MKSAKAMSIVRAVYDWVESALWAGLAAGVIYFLIFIAPNLPELARRAEAVRTLNNAAENGAYCEKWGMKRGDRMHARCIMDLEQLRKKIEQDLADRGSLI